jgi:glutamate transport system substrate-binding protein
MAPDGDFITFDTYSKCAEAMADGRADAVTTDNVILIGLIDDNPDAYELVDNAFTVEPYGVGVPEGSDLRCFVNEVLQQAYEDGSWAAAYAATVGTAGSATPEPPAVNNDGC